MTCCVRFDSGVCIIVALLTFVSLPGCKKATDETPKSKKNEKEEGKKKHDDEHPAAGPHGGPLAEWGDDDEFHAEFTVDHAAKKATVYILDGSAKKAPKIAPEKITKVKIETIDAKPAGFVDLEYDAKKSGADGLAFVGVHEMFAKSGELQLRISGTVDGKTPPFTGDITYTPKTIALSTTPGGIYTAKDIEANGNITWMEKYKGRTFDHGEAPKAGDKICPYSKEKANAECVWVIQGQSYQFCCQPCIGQFLKVAHNDPAKVKDAKAYVLKAK